MAVISRMTGSACNVSEHRGRVKLVNKEKGFGFIQCEEVYQTYGSDVFVFLRELVEYGVGDYVSFLMSVNARGQPQGRELQDCQLSSNAMVRNTEEPSYSGAIKSFDAGRGYGFIACNATFDIYGRDVFVHSKELQQFKPGDDVSFSIKVSRAGHPQAFGLNAPSLTELWLANGQVSSEELNVLGTHVGEVKSINAASEYGFIACAELRERFGGDVFFPTALLPGLAVSDQVEFEARVKRGNVQAHAIVRRAATIPARVETTTAAATIVGTSIKTDTPETAALTKKLLRACASARKESYREMFLLLNGGADPNGRDVTGQAAIMIAALNDGGGEKKCRLLVGMRADIHSVYREGLTVLDWARERVSHSFASHLEALSKGEQTDCLIVLNSMGSSEV